MKYLVIFLLFLNVIAFSFAAEYNNIEFKDPAYPGKCVYKNLVLSPGEEAAMPNLCARMICGENSIATVKILCSEFPLNTLKSN